MNNSYRPTAGFQGSLEGMQTSGMQSHSGVSGHPLHFLQSADAEILVVGEPTLRVGHGQPTVQAIGHSGALYSQLLEAFAKDGPKCFEKLTGRFAIALKCKSTDSLFLVTDRFASIPIYYCSKNSLFLFAESLTLLPKELRSSECLSRQAIYDYLYFHMVPGPNSVYANISKVPPASFLVRRAQNTEIKYWWQPTFDERNKLPFTSLARQLEDCLEKSVRQSANTDNVGCFLSGGLDSTTVLGFLRRAGHDQPRAFTIGFDAPEYDETRYARIAAKHFGADLVVHTARPIDILDAVNDIATAYDEPFGNSSAVPTLLCARLAKSNGVGTLLAGDGGDELFAGNARYAKQKIFQLYYWLPRTVRQHIFDPIGLEGSPCGRLPVLRKLHRYIAQANVPLPDRLETYNHLHRYGIGAVFSDRFLADIDISHPLRLLRGRYREPDEATLLNRMLYLDWKFTLTDNDLRKVSRMCEIAGVSVRYPMLDDMVVDLSTRIPSTLKLRKTHLRYFYRRALKDFLPPAVLKKRKHGFGLPFGVWLVQDPDLRNFAYSSLSRMQERDIFRQAFIESLKSATEQEHAAYYGDMIWVVVMLEQWLTHHHS